MVNAVINRSPDMMLYNVSEADWESCRQIVKFTKLAECNTNGLYGSIYIVTSDERVMVTDLARLPRP